LSISVITLKFLGFSPILFHTQDTDSFLTLTDEAGLASEEDGTTVERTYRKGASGPRRVEISLAIKVDSLSDAEIDAQDTAQQQD
jgi:hypothetical protein